MSDKKQALIRRLGHDFRDPSLIELALSHCSVGASNNERLEFLGDSIVNFLIGESLFQRFPSTQEGELSQMRAKLVRGSTLAEIARDLNLGDCLNLGPGELKSGGHRRQSILADAVEALVGAIYLDGGLDACRECVLSLYGERLNAITPKISSKDAKSLLQEYLQSSKKPLPVYRLVRQTGSDHEQQFEVECVLSHLNNRSTAIGISSSRRSAEQKAAQATLDILQKL